MNRRYGRVLLPCQNTWAKQHKGGKNYFGSQFQRFQIHLALMIWIFGEAEHHSGDGVVEQSCLPHDIQESESQRRAQDQK
jgi:hypothetical protein